MSMWPKAPTMLHHSLGRNAAKLSHKVNVMKAAFLIDAVYKKKVHLDH